MAGRTGVVAAGIAALVGMSLVVAPSASAGADGLRLRLSDAEGLRDGQVVEYAATGPALELGRVLEVWQCDADADLAVGGTLADLNRSCTSLDGRTVLGPGRRVTGVVTVQEVLTAFPPEPEPPNVVHCGDAPDDCSMVAVVRADDPEGHIDALAVVPIDVAPSPVAVGGPGLEGGTVRAWASGTPGATVALAQCVRFPGVARGLGSCVAGPTVVLSPTGRATTEVAVVATVVVDGIAYDCRARPCEVTAFDEAGAVLGSAAIPGSVPYADVTLDPATGLVHGDTFRARIDSDIPAGSASSVGICLASVLDDLPTSAGCYVYFPVTGPGAQEYELIAYEHFTPYGGGPEVSCGDDPGGCIVGVGTADTASGYAPIAFAAAPP